MRVGEKEEKGVLDEGEEEQREMVFREEKERQRNT